MRSNVLPIAISAAFAVLSPALFADAPMILVVGDPPGVGFNDPTPALPVGGNTGVTVGEQRLNAMRYAAGIWGSKLDSPVPIRVLVSFEPLPCTAQTGIAGAAGTTDLYSLTWPTPEVFSGVWYPAALANKIFEEVINPSKEEIEANFNINLGKPDCIAGKTWYYGLDTNAPEKAMNMVSVVLHELAHGLGFLPAAMPDGSRIHGKGDLYGQYVFDNSIGKTWNQMTDEELAVSVKNTRHLSWAGINVHKDAPKVLQTGTPVFRVTQPSTLAGDYAVGGAEFGARIATPGIGAELVAAIDKADNTGPSTTDACSPVLNALQLAGRIAFVDRGSCPFLQKAQNVQAAGAIGMVVGDNIEEAPPVEMAGIDPDVKIPALHISFGDAKAVKAALAAFEKVEVRLAVDVTTRRGTDGKGRPLLYAPNPPDGLAPVGHWDPSTTPNQLMEPDIMPDVRHSVEAPYDLTLALLRDIGWFSDFDGVPDGIDQCPDSDRGNTVRVQQCDTGIPNTTFPTGCRISDAFKPCTDFVNSGGSYAVCADVVSKELLRVGAIQPAESAKILACASPAANNTSFQKNE